jgi:hypothetical protein
VHVNVFLSSSETSGSAPERPESLGRALYRHRRSDASGRHLHCEIYRTLCRNFRIGDKNEAAGAADAAVVAME